MKVEEMIHKAHQQGAAGGQIALCEFILKVYGNEISPILKRLLEKVAQDCYATVSEISGKPSEDVALSVEKIMAEVVK